jgi:hypothetical protein
VDDADVGRRRWQTRKQRGNNDGPASPSPNPEDASGSPPPSRDGGCGFADASHLPRPRCIINRSNVFSLREESLAGCALVLSVIADDPGGLANFIVPEVARRFEIEEGLLSIQALGPATFLLISPNEHSATRIFNEGRPLSILPGRLHVMRWSRFLHSAAVLFPHALKVELKGIPAHAWDLETASHLLSGYCITGGIHSETVIQREVFQLATRCSNPSCVPPVIDLVIPELAGVVGIGD